MNRGRVIEEVEEERRRQQAEEGWSVSHDDFHTHGELADAAACYAMTSFTRIQVGHRSTGVPIFWPWGGRWWKPRERRRDLIRAAALLVAEIERLDRRSTVDASHDSRVLPVDSACEAKDREISPDLKSPKG